MRAVFDTNVFLRIILSKKPEGVAAALWQLLRQRQFEVVTSEDLLAELRDTLLVPELAEIHRWPVAQVHEYVDLLREIAVVVPGTSPVASPELAGRDPSDLPLLCAAKEGHAPFLVTQDADLLSLSAFEATEIVDPLAFLRQLREDQRESEPRK